MMVLWLEGAVYVSILHFLFCINSSVETGEVSINTWPHWGAWIGSHVGSVRTHTHIHMYIHMYNVRTRTQQSHPVCSMTPIHDSFSDLPHHNTTFSNLLNTYVPYTYSCIVQIRKQNAALWPQVGLSHYYGNHGDSPRMTLGEQSSPYLGLKSTSNDLSCNSGMDQYCLVCITL